MHQQYTSVTSASPEIILTAGFDHDRRRYATSIRLQRKMHWSAWLRLPPPARRAGRLLCSLEPWRLSLAP